MTWQTTETIPVGVDVLVASDQGLLWIASVNDDGTVDVCDLAFDRIGDIATHWMPLPLAPNQQEQAA